MKIKFIPEKTSLNSLIVGYSILETSSLADFNSTGVTLPDGFIEMYFSRYDPISIKMNSHNQAVYANSGFILGQTAKKIEFQPSGKIKLISVKIHPWASRFFLPDKAVLYSDKSSLIDDLGNKSLCQLQDKVLHSKSDHEALEYIKNHTIESIGTNSPYSEIIYNSVNYIYLNYKHFKVKTLTNLLNISRQYLERQFLEHIGISPKQFARIIRIRCLTEYYKINPRISFTELGYRFGYFDQSHFIKDFQLVANTSPKIFFTSENIVSSNFYSSM